MKTQGFRMIENQLYQAIMQGDFGKAEYKIMLAIINDTLGYQRKIAEISISRFMKQTGLSKPAVLKGIKELIKKGVISVERVGNNHHETTSYRFFDNPEVWKTGKNTLLVTSKNSLPDNVKNFTSTGKVLVPAIPDNKEIINKTSKEKSDDSFNSSSQGDAPPETPAWATGATSSLNDRATGATKDAIERLTDYYISKIGTIPVCLHGFIKACLKYRTEEEVLKAIDLTRENKPSNAFGYFERVVKNGVPNYAKAQESSDPGW